MAENVGYELGWDDHIEHDSPDFVVLPEGDYEFEVIDYERGRHPGSANLPPCNKVTVKIKIEGEEGISTIHHQLFLHSTTEGFLCAFFTAVGLRQKGQRYAMNFNAAVGKKGRAKVGIRKWTNDRGETKEFNEIKRFYEPEVPTYQAGRF